MTLLLRGNEWRISANKRHNLKISSFNWEFRRLVQNPKIHSFQNNSFGRIQSSIHWNLVRIFLFNFWSVFILYYVWTIKGLNGFIFHLIQRMKKKSNLHCFIGTRIWISWCMYYLEFEFPIECSKKIDEFSVNWHWNWNAHGMRRL